VIASWAPTSAAWNVRELPAVPIGATPPSGPPPGPFHGKPVWNGKTLTARGGPADPGSPCAFPTALDE